METKREVIQAAQYYDMPYHHIAKLVPSGGEKVKSFAIWESGIEYLCYMLNIVEKIKSRGYKSILDVGCGDGQLLYLLADTDIEKHGCDMDEHAILWAKAINTDATLHCQDVGKLAGEFPCVTLVEVLEHIPDELVPSFLKSVFARLAPEGTLFLQVPTVVMPVNSKHYRHYTLDLLKKQLDSCGVEYEISSVSYVFRRDFLYNQYIRFCFYNRFALLHIGPLDRFMWNHVNRVLKNATDKDGIHLLVELKKKQ